MISTKKIDNFNQSKKNIYGVIPSQVFDEYKYQLFLEFASVYELENDIITQETLDKMTEDTWKQVFFVV